MPHLRVSVCFLSLSTFIVLFFFIGAKAVKFTTSVQYIGGNYKEPLGKKKAKGRREHQAPNLQSSRASKKKQRWEYCYR